jgi:hypothetical protein
MSKDNPFAWNDAIQQMQQMEICEIMPKVTEHINSEWHNALEENPAESGEYVCTCVSMWNGQFVNRYIRVMVYNADDERWHDLGHERGISHSIIGWTEIPLYKKEFTVKQVRGF